MPAVNTPPVSQAKFSIVQGSSTSKVIDVDFNPESLQYTVSNTLGQASPNNPGTQFISQSVAKLTLDLVFDSTDTGVDVRAKTEKMLSLMKPSGAANQQVPPRVEFAWGVYTFAGIVEQYKETLDFFSHDGVPLRAAVNLTLTNDKAEFQSNHAKDAAVDKNAALQPAQVSNPGGPTDVANALGDPRAARAIAGLNASASLRFDASASLSVGSGVTLSPPAAFAGGGLGLSAGIGIGGGVGGGLSIGEGAGLGIEATAGAAFSGLRAGVSAGTGAASSLDPSRLFPQASAGTGMGFSPGGVARSGAGASLASNVGANANLNERISFGD